MEKIRTLEFRFSKAQILLTTLFIATNFTYFTMAPRILHIFHLYEPGGILIFPFTFLLSDVIIKLHIFALAQFSILSGLTFEQSKFLLLTSLETLLEL